MALAQAMGTMHITSSRLQKRIGSESGLEKIVRFAAGQAKNLINPFDKTRIVEDWKKSSAGLLEDALINADYTGIAKSISGLNSKSARLDAANYAISRLGLDAMPDELENAIEVTGIRNFLEKTHLKEGLYYAGLAASVLTPGLIGYAAGGAAAAAGMAGAALLNRALFSVGYQGAMGLGVPIINKMFGKNRKIAAYATAGLSSVVSAAAGIRAFINHDYYTSGLMFANLGSAFARTNYELKGDFAGRDAFDALGSATMASSLFTSSAYAMENSNVNEYLSSGFRGFSDLIKTIGSNINDMFKVSVAHAMGQEQQQTPSNMIACIVPVDYEKLDFGGVFPKKPYDVQTAQFLPVGPSNDASFQSDIKTADLTGKLISQSGGEWVATLEKNPTTWKISAIGNNSSLPVTITIPGGSAWCGDFSNFNGYYISVSLDSGWFPPGNALFIGKEYNNTGTTTPYFVWKNIQGVTSASPLNVWYVDPFNEFKITMPWDKPAPNYNAGAEGLAAINNALNTAMANIQPVQFNAIISTPTAAYPTATADPTYCGMTSDFNLTSYSDFNQLQSLLAGLTNWKLLEVGKNDPISWNRWAWQQPTGGWFDDTPSESTQLSDLSIKLGTSPAKTINYPYCNELQSLSPTGVVNPYSQATQQATLPASISQPSSQYDCPVGTSFAKVDMSYYFSGETSCDYKDNADPKIGSASALGSIQNGNAVCVDPKSGHGDLNLFLTIYQPNGPATNYAMSWKCLFSSDPKYSTQNNAVPFEATPSTFITPSP